MLEAYLAVLAGTCAAQIAPGPNLMAVASTALGQGRRASLFVVSGVASGVLVWCCAVAFGLGAVFAAVPALLTLLKFAGGGYLLWLGIRGIVASLRGEAVTIRPIAASLSGAQAWRRGFLVVMTNPKAALMWSAVATFLFGAGLSAGQVVAFGPVGALTALLIYGTYGVLFSTGFATRGYNRFARFFEAVFGAAFGALGARLVLDGIRDLRS